MKTTIITNSLKELKIVSDYFDIKVNASEITVSFPYLFEIENYSDNEEISFKEWCLSEGNQP